MGIIGERKFHANVEDCSSPPTSCHFVVPSKVVMKGLKKIRKRIGLASKPSFAGLDGLSLQSIRFHTTHGTNISLHKNRTVARRHESFCKGITFTDRPIRVDEKIYIKLIEKSDNWSGVIRFGFTAHDPCTLKDGLPKYACPDLTSRKGFWAKAVNETLMDKDATMYFYVNKSGTVYYGLESPLGGRTKDEFFTGVDVNCGPLWAMIDVYGNSTAVELVNVRLNNSLIADQEAGFALDDYTTRKIRVDTNELSSEMRKLTCKPSSNTPRVSDFYEQRRPHSQGFVSSTFSNTERTSIQPTLSSPPSNDTFYSSAKSFTNPPVRGRLFDLKLTPLPFHEKCGLNVRLSDNKCIASRVDKEYCRGYVFTPYPIVANEFIVVEILKTDPEFMSGMAFGVTSENPARMNMHDLPEDADELLDRSKSFIVYKNVANTPSVRDNLVFSMTENGEIKMKKNGEQEISLFHVERDVPYWWFFDLFGSTSRIRSFTGTLESPKKRSVSAMSMCSDNVPNVQQSNPINRTPMHLPFVSENQRGPLCPSTSMPMEFVNDAPSMNMNHNVNPVAHSATMNNGPPVLVVKCFANGYEPINIFLQNQPTSNGSIIASGPSQMANQLLPLSVRNRAAICGDYVTVNPTNRMSNCDVSSIENGRNREYQLQEWAKSNSRGHSANGSLNECSVCYERPVDAVLYACGHMCMCYGCATSIWHRGGGHCPICRAAIVDVIKTYKS